ncbi:MAG: FimV/HubP family polar landmark protein, partial [Gammaproteobacteria bacterium]
QQPTTTKPMSPPVTAASAASATGSEQPVQQTTRVASLPSSYTVHRGDTLWGIARQLHNGTEASVNQTMIAIYQANPQAFHGNINRLDAGSTLKVPTQSEIAQVEAEEATRLVTRQNDAWRGAGAAPRTAANNSVPEQQQPVPATTGQAASENAPPQPVVAPTSSSASTQAAGEPAAKPATSGRVVLTTPEVTAATSVAAAPGSSAAASTAIAGAAGAMGTTQKTQASATHSAAAGMAGTGASTGGPMKVQNNAMAGMAAAKQPVTASKAATTLPSQKPKLKTPNSVNSVNSVNASGQQQSSGLMYWLGRPVGWIVIAAIILILIAIVLLILRQRRNAAEQPVPLVVPGGEHETDEHGNESVVDNEESDLETKENLEDIGIATYIGGSSLDVNKVDAMDEADLHVGFGEYGKAAQILRAGIERQPQRKELRRKLLDVLFAASESSAFAAEARNYKKEVAGAADWQAVAAMGRQLCPQDEFFKDGGTTAGNAGTSEGDDFANLDLDRLARDEDDGKEQDEFERTMDELSTFIETYVPASTETPVALQLPPDEVASEEPAKSEADAESAPEDEPIDFHLDDEDLPPVASETMPEGAEEDEAENMVDTKLDLARAYIDMGDTDSARGVLEEVIDEGDEKQSDEARRLLEDLD